MKNRTKIMIDLPEDLRKSIFDDGVFHISDGYRLAGCVMQGKIVEESKEDNDAIKPDEFADEFTEALDKFNDAIDAIDVIDAINASRNAKVIKQLSAHVKCLECQVSGNLCKGDECPTQYEAGTMGEIIANIKTAIMALKQELCEDAIS